MTRLEALKKSLLDMTPDELRAKVSEIREDRKLRKESKKTRTDRVKTQSSAKDHLVALAASMSPEEFEAFITEMGE